MRRHPADITSLVLGLLLLAVAGLYLGVDLSGSSVDLRWAAPAALIAVGALGLAASVRRR
jgi:hypothetical protein